MIIRTEMPVDKSTIRSVVTTAFKDAPRSGGNEADIVDALRDSNALAISLVAEEDGDIVGHVAFSAVSINGQDVGWYGLGPVAVRADKRRRGFGKTLISSGLERIEEMGARGCVVLGDRV
jgi:putative acetyltransferase